MRKTVFAAFLLVPIALFASPPCPNPTLTISGMQGEGCGGTIDFASANYSTTTQDLKVMRYMDSSSPKLMSDCASGAHLQKVTLTTPNISTDGTNHPIVVTFEDVQVMSVDESINPTNENVVFKYAKRTIESGGSQTTGGSVRGSAHGGTLNVAVVGADGKSQSASHFEMSIRPGGMTTTSVQLLAPNPPPIRTGMLKVTTPANNAAPQPHMDNGVIEIRSPNGAVLGRYSFSGGVFNGNTLRSQRVNLAGAARAMP